MFIAIESKNLPKGLTRLELDCGTINTNSRLFKDKDKVYKFYHQCLPFRYASEIHALSQQNIPHALFPEAFIINDKYQVIGDVTPFIEDSQTLTQKAQLNNHQRSINDRIPKMYQLISFVDALNRLKYYHNDLHSDNFLSTDSNIYAIDLVGIRKKENISEHQKHLNEILLSYLFGLTKNEANNLLTNESYRLRETLAFAPRFIDFLISGSKRSDNDLVLDELYDHDKEATEIHKSSKSL